MWDSETFPSAGIPDRPFWFHGYERQHRIDKHTADVLQTRAAELGVTVPQLVAELATLDSEPRDADAAEIAELDRRVAKALDSGRVPNDRVVCGSRTWGTPQYRPWRGQPTSSGRRTLSPASIYRPGSFGKCSSPSSSCTP